jgi:hypothetical protein
MKNIVATLCLSSFFFSNVCLSQEKLISLPKIELPSGEQDPGAAISPMHKGQKAPFTGVLLSPEATSTVIVEYQERKKAIAIEVENAVLLERESCRKNNADQQLKYEEQKKIQQVRLEESMKAAKDLEEKLNREKEDRPSRILWTGLGAAGGVAATILIVFAVNKASNN